MARRKKDLSLEKLEKIARVKLICQDRVQLCINEDLLAEVIDAENLESCSLFMGGLHHYSKIRNLRTVIGLLEKPNLKRWLSDLKKKAQERLGYLHVANLLQRKGIDNSNLETRVAAIKFAILQARSDSSSFLFEYYARQLLILLSDKYDNEDLADLILSLPEPNMGNELAVQEEPIDEGEVALEELEMERIEARKNHVAGIGGSGLEVNGALQPPAPNRNDHPPIAGANPAAAQPAAPEHLAPSDGAQPLGEVAPPPAPAPAEAPHAPAPADGAQPPAPNGDDHPPVAGGAAAVGAAPAPVPLAPAVAPGPAPLPLGMVGITPPPVAPPRPVPLEIEDWLNVNDGDGLMRNPVENYVRDLTKSENDIDVMFLLLKAGLPPAEHDRRKIEGYEQAVNVVQFLSIFLAGELEPQLARLIPVVRDQEEGRPEGGVSRWVSLLFLLNNGHVTVENIMARLFATDYQSLRYLGDVDNAEKAQVFLALLFKDGIANEAWEIVGFINSPLHSAMAVTLIRCLDPVHFRKLISAPFLNKLINNRVSDRVVGTLLTLVAPAEQEWVLTKFVSLDHDNQTEYVAQNLCRFAGERQTRQLIIELAKAGFDGRTEEYKYDDDLLAKLVRLAPRPHGHGPVIEKLRDYLGRDKLYHQAIVGLAFLFKPVAEMTQDLLDMTVKIAKAINDLDKAVRFIILQVDTPDQLQALRQLIERLDSADWLRIPQDLLNAVHDINPYVRNQRVEIVSNLLVDRGIDFPRIINLLQMADTPAKTAVLLRLSSLPAMSEIPDARLTWDVLTTVDKLCSKIPAAEQEATIRDFHAQIATAGDYQRGWRVLGDIADHIVAADQSRLRPDFITANILGAADNASKVEVAALLVCNLNDVACQNRNIADFMRRLSDPAMAANKTQLIRSLLNRITETDRQLQLLSKLCEINPVNRVTVDIAIKFNRYSLNDLAQNTIVGLVNEGIVTPSLNMINVVASSANIPEVIAVFARVPVGDLNGLVQRFNAENPVNRTAGVATALAIGDDHLRDTIVGYLNQVRDAANKTVDVVNQLMLTGVDTKKEAIVALANRGINGIPHLAVLIDITEDIHLRSGCSFDEAAEVASRTNANLNYINALTALLNVDPRQVTLAKISQPLLHIVYTPDPVLQERYARIICKLLEKGVATARVIELLVALDRVENAIHNRHLGIAPPVLPVAPPDQVTASLNTFLVLIDKLPLTSFTAPQFEANFLALRNITPQNEAERTRVRESLFRDVTGADANFLFQQFALVTDLAKRTNGLASRLNHHFDAANPASQNMCRFIAESVERDLGLTDRQCQQMADGWNQIVAPANRRDVAFARFLRALNNEPRRQAVIALANYDVIDADFTEQRITLAEILIKTGFEYSAAAQLAINLAGNANQVEVFIHLAQVLDRTYLNAVHMTIELAAHIYVPDPARMEKSAQLVKAMYEKGMPVDEVRGVEFNHYDALNLNILGFVVNELSVPQLTQFMQMPQASRVAILTEINNPVPHEPRLMQAKAKLLNEILKKGIADQLNITTLLNMIPLAAIPGGPAIALTDPIEQCETLSLLINMLERGVFRSIDRAGHAARFAATNGLVDRFTAVAIPAERREVQALLFSGVANEAVHLALVNEFIKLPQDARTYEAAFRLKNNAYKISEEEKFKLRFICYAIAHNSVHLTDKKCAELAKAVMQIDLAKRPGLNPDFIAAFAAGGADAQKISLIVRLINQLPIDVTQQMVNVAYAMMQKGADMTAAVTAMVALHTRIEALEAVVNNLTRASGIHLITLPLLQAIHPPGGPPAQPIDPNKAIALAALISKHPNPLPTQPVLLQIVPWVDSPAKAAIFELIVSNLDAVDINALSEGAHSALAALLNMPGDPNAVLNALWMDVSTSADKRSLLQSFASVAQLPVRRVQNLSVPVAQALNRERVDVNRRSLVVRIAQFFEPVQASDVCKEVLDIFLTHTPTERGTIRRAFFALASPDQRTVAVLEAMARYPAAGVATPDARRREIVTLLAQAGVTEGPGLEPAIINFLRAPRFIGPGGVIAITPPTLLADFGRITLPENRTLSVLQLLSNTPDDIDRNVIVALASVEHPVYTPDAIMKFKQHGMMDIPDEKTRAILAKTGDNYDRVHEDLLKVEIHKRTPFIAKKLAEFGGDTPAEASKREVIAMMANVGLPEEKITDKLIAVIVELPPDKREKVAENYRDASPAKYTRALSLFADRSHHKSERLEAMLVDVKPLDPSASPGGLPFRKLCQVSPDPDSDLAAVQTRFRVKRQQTKRSSGLPPEVTEHALNTPLPTTPKEGKVSGVVFHLDDEGGTKVVMSAEKPSQLELIGEQYNAQTARAFGQLLTSGAVGAQKGCTFFREADLARQVNIELDGKAKEIPLIVLIVLIQYKQDCKWFKIGEKPNYFLKNKGECIKFLKEYLRGWEHDLLEKLIVDAESFVNNPDLPGLGM